MNVGVFLCLEPYTSLENNLKLAKAAGFDYADITDTHSSGSMFASAGLSASVSLDDNPFEVKRTFERCGMHIMTLSAHAVLLEPSSPANYATAEIMKAIKFAAGAGIEYVITTETFAKSEWAKKLTYEQSVFIAAEKLYNPCKMAADYGIKLCLEQHGPLTDTIDGIGDIMSMLGDPPALGVNLDTGNSWLGGTNPVELAKKYKNRIYHIHWKDLGEEWLPKRGTIFGCGMSNIELGTGCIDIAGVIEVLKDRREIKYSTLEVVGPPELLRNSTKYIQDRWNS